MRCKTHCNVVRPRPWSRIRCPPNKMRFCDARAFDGWIFPHDMSICVVKLQSIDDFRRKTATKWTQLGIRPRRLLLHRNRCEKLALSPHGVQAGRLAEVGPGRRRRITGRLRERSQGVRQDVPRIKYCYGPPSWINFPSTFPVWRDLLHLSQPDSQPTRRPFCQPFSEHNRSQVVRESAPFRARRHRHASR